MEREGGGGGGVMDIFYFLELYNTLYLAEVKKLISAGQTGMAQWWEYLPPSNAAWIQFPDKASYIWVMEWYFLFSRAIQYYT